MLSRPLIITAIPTAISTGCFVGLLALSVIAGCAHEKTSPPTPTSTRPAPKIAGATPVAISSVDAPGLNVDDLTARLRDSFEDASGVPVVDEVSMRTEIAACVELPCPTTLQDRFRDADKIVNVTVSKVGKSILGSLRVTMGLKEVVRINAQGTDAAKVISQLGHEGGAALHTILTTRLPAATGPESAER